MRVVDTLYGTLTIAIKYREIDKYMYKFSNSILIGCI